MSDEAPSAPVLRDNAVWLVAHYDKETRFTASYPSVDEANRLWFYGSDGYVIAVLQSSSWDRVCLEGAVEKTT